MPKEKSSMETGSPPLPSPMYTSSLRSSSDHELAWATHCRVAVMKASGAKRPPSQKVDDFRVPLETRPTLNDEKEGCGKFGK